PHRVALFLTRPSYGIPFFPYTTLFRSPHAVCNLRNIFSFSIDQFTDNQPHKLCFSLVEGRSVVHLVSLRRKFQVVGKQEEPPFQDRKSTRLNSSHVKISYSASCLQKTW